MWTFTMPAAARARAGHDRVENHAAERMSMNHLPIRSVRFVALALTMESAHGPEWPLKMDCADQMYSAVNESIEP